MVSSECQNNKHWREAQLSVRALPAAAGRGEQTDPAAGRSQRRAAAGPRGKPEQGEAREHFRSARWV